MMKYLLLALAITAVSAQAIDPDIDPFLEGHEMIDALLASGMELPCTPKPCVPVCKPVTKYLTYGDFKISYVENECAPDPKCLAAAATCVKKIQGLMVDADKKAKALEAASKKKNKLGASKKQKAEAAKKKKAEAAAAKKALSGAKKAFEVAEKEAATAKASMEKSKKSYAAKSKVMEKRLVAYEKAKKKHLFAVAAYDGAKSAAALAASLYDAAIKAHCDAEAQHAEAVKKIGHGHLAQKNCAKYSIPAAPLKTNQVKVSGIKYSVIKAKKNALFNIDRSNYRLKSVPSKFAGSVLIKTPHDFPRGATVKITAPGKYTIYAAMMGSAHRWNRDAGYRSAKLLEKAGWKSLGRPGLKSPWGLFDVYEKTGCTGTTRLPKTTRDGIVTFFVKA